MKQPKYCMGDRVEFTVTAHLKGDKREYSVKDTGWIKHIHMGSTESDIEYEYGITDDLPRAYHAGKSAFITVKESELVRVETHTGIRSYPPTKGGE